MPVVLQNFKPKLCLVTDNNFTKIFQKMPRGSEIFYLPKLNGDLFAKAVFLCHVVTYLILGQNKTERPCFRFILVTRWKLCDLCYGLARPIIMQSKEVEYLRNPAEKYFLIISNFASSYLFDVFCGLCQNNPQHQLEFRTLF